MPRIGRRTRRFLLGPVGRFLARFDAEATVLQQVARRDHDLAIANGRLVSSRGILAACDVRPPEPRSSFADEDYVASIPARVRDAAVTDRPTTIHVCTEAIASFARRALPAIDRDFVLVSGDSDLVVDAGTLGEALDAVAGAPRLVRWFAQNRGADRPRLASLPIGLDYHTRWARPYRWGGGLGLPSSQEILLRITLRDSPYVKERIRSGWCDWAQTMDRGDRAECLARVAPGTATVAPVPVSREETWRGQARHRFVLSPSGYGPDCHRTWEALALGAIPIVRRHPIADLFAGLPVLVVDDWSEVTRDALERIHHEWMEERFDFSGLLLETWKARIGGREGPAAPLPRMTQEEFRTFLTA
ncbi:MAG TPA: hypothetical protein PLL32_01530 [Anaeromyxobacteraceae bacterium]|nr:hypothetical protein [Anaeromyxobacteraceae bacterium]